MNVFCFYEKENCITWTVFVDSCMMLISVCDESFDKVAVTCFVFSPFSSSMTNVFD